MLYIVQLEPLEERYTEQWQRWIPAALHNLSTEFEIIEGDQLTSKIEVGNVLDVFGTNYYKFSQLQKIIKMFHGKQIKDGDVFWFADAWFPGVEALAYIRNMTKINFVMTGVLHAGTWDNYDFTARNGMRNWGKHIERGWLSFFDELYLGSFFHKKLIVEKNDDFIDPNKLIVTGLPFEVSEAGRFFDGDYSKKENIVVFPHRVDPEKDPSMFKAMADELRPLFPNWQFIMSKDFCSTKKEYYNLLARSKIAVSCALQETFGYAMLEAIANGCTPILRRGVSYDSMGLYTQTGTTVFGGFSGLLDLTTLVRIQIENFEKQVSDSEDANARSESLRNYAQKTYKTERVMQRMFDLKNARIQDTNIV